jgi:hypothetical protein
LACLLEGEIYPDYIYARLKWEILDLYPEDRPLPHKHQIEFTDIRQCVFKLPSEEYIKSRGTQLLWKAYNDAWGETRWVWTMSVQREEPAGDVEKMPVALVLARANRGDGEDTWWITELKPSSKHETRLMEKMMLPDA